MPQDRSLLRSAQRIVVKVGTSVVRSADGGLALGRLGHLVQAIAALRRADRKVLLVSSGAIGLGVERLGFRRRPKGLADQQACAAAGQGALTSLYDTLFARVGLSVAQVLLTEADFHDRRRYVTLNETLGRLLQLGALPLLNENDAISPEHLAVFGDNDRLASLVATNVGCDALVLLSDVDGLYTAPPSDPDARRLPVFDASEPIRMGAVSATGRGGMSSKVEAARLAARSGVPAVIASGMHPDGLLDILGGENVGTLFPPEGVLSQRRRWLAFATAPQGELVVNAGARAAMVERQASLLLPGVLDVCGCFDAGAVVRILFEGEEFARGVCARSSDEVRGSLGSSERGKALVHRDHVAILEDR